MLELIANLSKEKFNIAVQKVVALPEAASDRRYFRVTATDNQTYIVTYAPDVVERARFIRLSRELLQLGCSVPKVLQQYEAFYVQEDVGAATLLSYLKSQGETPELRALYQEALRQLLFLQTEASKKVCWAKILQQKHVDYSWVLEDLFAFKHYFLDRMPLVYRTSELIYDFEECLRYFVAAVPKKWLSFLYRDFQARNIVLRADGRLFFVDFQSAMLGPLGYDLVSLLYQVGADLSDEWIADLKKYYVKEVVAFTKINKQSFTQFLDFLAVFRLMQVLGTYGRKGLLGGMIGFAQKIVPALQRLSQVLTLQPKLLQKLPTLKILLEQMTSEEGIRHWKEVLGMDKEVQGKLVVEVSSFSYLKGLPRHYNNGGGFVWDCRFIKNPGREEKYRPLTGRDRAVKTYLEKKTFMPEFLQSVYSVLNAVITDYLEKEHYFLSVAFGCTGGQHRSVYAAETLAQFLSKKYKKNIEVIVTHRELGDG